MQRVCLSFLQRSRPTSVRLPNSSVSRSAWARSLSVYTHFVWRYILLFLTPHHRYPTLPYYTGRSNYQYKAQGFDVYTGDTCPSPVVPGSSFNATMPIQMNQILLLSVFLEKTVFTPVGEILGARAKVLKAKTSL